jgi:hypothetical protein
MKNKKDDYQTVWEWLLEMGPWKAFRMVMVIGILVGALLLWCVHWYTRKYF